MCVCIYIYFFFSERAHTYGNKLSQIFFLIDQITLLLLLPLERETSDKAIIAETYSSLLISVPLIKEKLRTNSRNIILL